MERGTQAGSGFLRTRNPLHNPFLCIFKHNEILTNLSTAFSHKVGMGSGFWVLVSRELGRVPHCQEPGTLYVFPSWKHPFIYQDLVFEKRAHTVLQREKTHVVLISQERERV